MSIIQTNYVTFSCNGPGCAKTMTFEATPQGQALALTNPDNAWLRTSRRVLSLLPLPGQQQPLEFLYCSDICEVQAVGTGAHNLPEPKRIVEAASNPASVALAAEAAKRVSEATTALKAGSGVTLHQG